MQETEVKGDVHGEGGVVAGEGLAGLSSIENR